MMLLRCWLNGNGGAANSRRQHLNANDAPVRKHGFRTCKSQDGLGSRGVL